MKCPKCGGKVNVMDTVHNTDLNEIYRERICEDCGHIFYTTEYEVVQNQAFEEDWAQYHRREYAHTKRRIEK